MAPLLVAGSREGAAGTMPGHEGGGALESTQGDQGDE